MNPARYKLLQLMPTIYWEYKNMIYARAHHLLTNFMILNIYFPLSLKHSDDDH